jgi:DNA-binding NtrC family response regulator
LAKSQVPVIVVGDEGTGAADLAAEIHRAGGGRKPFVQVPCGQLAFAAAALAGHVQGAWSGADQGSEGLARRAGGGTLVLDRVEELDRQAQKVVARLCDGFVRPVGSPVEVRVDVRLIATCRDESSLAPELRHRLAGAVLRLAPLRERRGEIAGLVERFLAGRRPITADALADLAHRPWPGNISELRAAVERLVAFSDGPIGIKVLRRVLRTPESRRPASFVDRKRASRHMALAMA